MKDKRLEIRLSTKLYNILQLKAEASNKKPSEYIRSIIVNSDIKVDNYKDVCKLIFQVNKIGNNLNQIAHTLNIANNKNKLDDIKYNNLLNELIVIEHFLNELSNEFI